MPGPFRSGQCLLCGSGLLQLFVFQIIISFNENLSPTYTCSPAGAEIDLILEFSPTEKWAIEIKRNSAPTVTFSK